MDRTQEARAAHFFQRGLYSEALQAYTNCIGNLPSTCKPEVRTNLIFNRSACYLKLKQFQRVVEDCNLILNIDSKHEKALGRKIKAMCSLGRFSDAQSLAHQWIQSDPMNQQAVKELERLNVIVRALKEQEDEDNIIMGSTGKNSPLHSKTGGMTSPQSQRTGITWNTTQPRSGSSLLWQQQNNNPTINSSITRDGDPWGQQSHLPSMPIITERRDAPLPSSNSVWGMAINTTWGDTVEDKLAQSNDFPALSSSGSVIISKNDIITGSNENTSLVWSNNPLSGSAQQVASLPSTSSTSLLSSSQGLNPVLSRANPHRDTLFNGKTNENVSSLFCSSLRESETTVNNTQSSNSGLSNVQFGLEQDLGSLWSNPAALSDRQRPLSPPWSQSSKSRFSFANREVEHVDNKSNGTHETITSSIGQPLPPMIWRTQSTADRSDNFPNLNTEDTFSALKSLISSAPKHQQIPATTFQETKKNNTDKLLLQHMQRNTGPVQYHYQSSSDNDLSYISSSLQKSEIVDRLTKAGKLDDTNSSSRFEDENINYNGVSNSTSEDGLTRQSSVEERISGIPQSFIPPVIQRKMMIGKKVTDTYNTTKSTSSFVIEESSYRLASSLGLDTTIEKSNGIDSTVSSEALIPNSSSDSLKAKGSTLALPTKDEMLKFEGSVHCSTSSVDGSVISTTSSNGSTSALDSTNECNSVKDEEKESSVPNTDIQWKYRQPPRGLTSQEYTKCPRYQTYGMCSFGENCSQAHSDEELKEWKERFEEHKKQLLLTKESDKQGESYCEKLMEKLFRAENTNSVMTETVDGVNIHVNSKLSMTTQLKKSSHMWLFTVTSKMFLQKVALIEDDSRKHYHIASITMGPKKPKKNQRVMKVSNHCQEWDNPEFIAGKFGTDKVFRIKITFRTDIFGTFRQSVVLDFGLEPVVVRNICVDSCPVTDLEQLSKDLILSESGRWDINNLNVVDFKQKIFTMDDVEKSLLDDYPAPTASKITALPQSLMDPTITKDNYRDRLHSMLNIEEMAQFSSIAKFNVQTSLQIARSFMLMPSTASTAKYAQNGQLFARMELTSDLSEDSSHGRLILQNVYTVYLAKCQINSEDDEQVPEKVYEAMIEEKGKNFIFLRLSENCVADLKLKNDMTLEAQVQFQLNRMPLCEMHMAVDKLPSVNIVFPSPESLLHCPWTVQSTTELCDERLNEKQKEAVLAITAKADEFVPPILLIGPYGTGKTFTLAQAAKQILKQDNTRVLICTHSNSAADLYIREYLHPYVIEGHPEALPLRVYYRHRWVQTVNHVTLQYCLTKMDRVRGTIFVDPTKADVEKRRVIVATFSTCRQLCNLGLSPGYFTHILLDEAAQALECETLMPLAMADEHTRIVLAGDHMQLSPEIHSDFATDRLFHISLLERLYDLYPHNYACKIMLCENYRSHKAIIDFTSELFYDSKLVASGSQLRHEKFYPLTFFTARGEDTQHQNSTAYYNNAEVYEIVERVSEVQRHWPKSWGTLDDTSIGVVSPYTDQVVRIRAELRKKKLHHVSVERVLNVQGKQFRVIFLSTVRTRHTCSSDAAMEEFMDYGFLSNVKLLNTAITRAQSLVAVVGDPVSLCSIGKCRKLWERFLEICTSNSSMHGMTWTHLRAQLDGVELKKTYILNPLAPEFVPNRLRHTQYAPPEPIAYGRYGFAFAPTSKQQPPMGLPPSMAWQHNPRLMQMMPTMMPPHMYMNPALQYQYMAMLQSGLPGMHPNYGQFLPQNKPKLDAMKAAFIVPRHPGKPNVAPSTGAATVHESLGHHDVKSDEEERSTDDKTDKSDNTKVFGLGGTRGSAGGVPSVGQQQQQPPPMQARINPMYLPPQYQRFPGLPGQMGPNFIQPPPYHALLNPGGRGFSLSPYALGPPPQLQAILSPGKTSQLPRNTPPVAPSTVMAIRNIHSPSLSPRSNRSNSRSPTRMAMPSTANNSVEFLPKAVNIRNSAIVEESRAAHVQIPRQLPHKMAVNPYGIIPKGLPRSTLPLPPSVPSAMSQANSLMKSPFLQRELYSYIMQTEGQMAAESFVSNFANSQQENSMLQQQPPQQQHHHHHSDHLTGVQLQQQPPHPHQLLPSSSDYPTNIPPPFYPGHPMTGNGMGQPVVPQQQFMAQDLEKQWQEESLREHSNTRSDQSKDYDGMAGSHSQAKFGDRYGFHNPNFEQFHIPKKQSPFGDGPQPYSRQKAYGEVRRESQDKIKDCTGASGDARNGSRPSSQNSDRHTSSITSALSVDTDQSGIITEKELGQIHIDSPVGNSLTPPVDGTKERKVPLYMRRVADTDTIPPPRLSYAGALQSQNSTGSAENTPPTAGPQTVGPVTPGDYPFFQGRTDREPDPLELLRNLNIKESPGTQALFQYFS